MRLKVLLTGQDKFDHEPDVELLRDRGFLVYRCEETAVNDMIEEVQPDVLIINPTDEQPSSNGLYNRLLKSLKYAKLPLIYTVSEDDVYLVNRKRTSARDKRNFIADNIIDGIKTALGGNHNDLHKFKLRVAS